LSARLCIHLGDVKTGSTSIQQTLKHGRFRCESRSLVYPVDDDAPHHIRLADALRKNAGAGDPALVERRFGRTARRVRASGADVAVLSAEGFEFVDPAALRAALEAHFPEFAGDARLIAYLRPHPERVLSAFQESVKIGVFGGTLEQFHRKRLRSGTFRYLPRLRRWRDVFGDRYEVRPMMRSRLADNCVVRDFLGFALEGAAFDLLQEPASNPSLSVEDLAMMREVHRIRPQMRPGAPRRVAEALTRGGAPGGTPLRLHRALLERIRESYADDAAAVDREFFEGGPLTEALETAGAKAVDRPQSLRAEDHFGPEELRRIRAMAELGEVALDRRPGAKRAAADRAREPGAVVRRLKSLIAS
jgi:hypothetical protein